MLSHNILLMTDVYKMGHMEQYPTGISHIYSYLHTRSDKKYQEIVVYGLQALIKDYLQQPVTDSMIDEFLIYWHNLLGRKPSAEIYHKLVALRDLGYLPLEIKSWPEGTVLPAKSVIATVTNTLPGFYWVVGFFESLLLHLWNPITVASASRQYYRLAKHYAELTCEQDHHLPFAVHDFGYRAVSSNETAMISGSAHLIHFLGTDTILALKYIRDHYEVAKGDSIGCAVPASEHSVMSAYEQPHEIDAFHNMLDLYPEGTISIVSDTYDIYHAVTDIARALKQKILQRDGKVVFRPDSGHPIHVLCGDPQAKLGSKEHKGILWLLEEIFGSSWNSKGYKVLSPKIGVLWGDGMSYEAYQAILIQMEAQKWASSNIVIGVGGLLLQCHSRDDLGVSFKASQAKINGRTVDIYKSPVTAPEKKSMRGLICCQRDDDGRYLFADQQTESEEKHTLLTTIYKDGQLLAPTNWKEIRTRAQNSS